MHVGHDEAAQHTRSLPFIPTQRAQDEVVYGWQVRVHNASNPPSCCTMSRSAPFSAAISGERAHAAHLPVADGVIDYTVILPRWCRCFNKTGISRLT